GRGAQRFAGPVAACLSRPARVGAEPMSVTDLDPAFAPAREGRPAAIPAVASPLGRLVSLKPATARGRQLPRWLRRTTGPVALVLAWHLASVTGLLPAEVLAGPATVLSSAARLAASGELQDAITVSMGRAMAGLALGGSI